MSLEVGQPMATAFPVKLNGNMLHEEAYKLMDIPIVAVMT